MCIYEKYRFRERFGTHNIISYGPTLSLLCSSFVVTPLILTKPFEFVDFKNSLQYFSYYF